MRLGPAACLILALASGPAWAQSRDLPTPATPGPNPGAAATDAIVSPTKPAPVTPSTGIGTASDATPSQTPPAPPERVAPPQPRASATPPASTMTGSGGELREILEVARAIAKATQDNVEYGRVVPDILTQILAKLDKLENKLDKIEDVLKAAPRARR